MLEFKFKASTIDTFKPLLKLASIMTNNKKYDVPGYTDEELCLILNNSKDQNYEKALNELLKRIALVASDFLSNEENQPIADRLIDQLIVNLRHKKKTLLSKYEVSQGRLVYFLGQFKFLKMRYFDAIKSENLKNEKQVSINAADNTFEFVQEKLNTRKISINLDVKENGKNYAITKLNLATYANYHPELAQHANNQKINEKGKGLYLLKWDLLPATHQKRLHEVHESLKELTTSLVLGQQKTKSSKLKKIQKIICDYEILKLKIEDYCKIMSVSEDHAQQFRSKIRKNKNLITVI